MAARDQNTSGWKKAKNWIVGLTGVLLVIPALLNSGIDIYNILLNIPRTAAEKHNTELFAKHFNQEPVVSLPVPVRQGSATYEAKFSIYKEGDIYVEYGDMTQWFPFPKTRGADAAPFSLIASAYAEEPATQIAAAYKQTESIEDGYLIRNKVYDSGVTEKQVIDMKTGKIVEQSQSTTPEPPSTSTADVATPPPPPAPVQLVSPFAVIDLNALKNNQDENATAKTCKTAQGTCTLLRAVPLGSECACPSNKGDIRGIAQ